MDEPIPVDLIPRDQALAAIETFTQDMATMADRSRQQYLSLERKYERSRAARARDIEWMFDRANPLPTLVKATPQTPEQKEKRLSRLGKLEFTDGSVRMRRLKGADEWKDFLFTRVFHGEHATNADMFAEDISRLVRSTITGRSFLLLAYGGTGSGKSYSILHNVSNDPSIMHRTTIDLLYDAGCTLALDGLEVQLQGDGRFFEIGGETLQMSLSPGKRWVLEYAPAVPWKPSDPIGTKSEALARVEHLYENRLRRTTKGNSQSSRSHGIFDLQVYDSQSVPQGRLTFVDLAGLEDSQASKGQEQATPGAGTLGTPTIKPKTRRNATPGTRTRISPTTRATTPRKPTTGATTPRNLAAGTKNQEEVTTEAEKPKKGHA